MDLCHIKKVLSETRSFRKTRDVTCEGRIVSATTPVNYAVFTEQSTSASHMTAAKVLDVNSRLPGCTGQASDAVGACTNGIQRRS